MTKYILSCTVERDICTPQVFSSHLEAYEEMKKEYDECSNGDGYINNDIAYCNLRDGNSIDWGIHEVLFDPKIMKKLLVVVDMQNDFVDGTLGTDEAVAIVPSVVEKIRSWNGDVIATQDTHDDHYCTTREGKHLPIAHCINGTHGHCLHDDVYRALTGKNMVSIVGKNTFGSQNLIGLVRENGYDYVELIGLCTDICVVSNTLLLKNAFPELDIAVDAKCCAGVTPKSHEAALLTMKMCQIEVLNHD